MKGRKAYAEFESRILDLYERGALTLNLLDRIAGQYSLVSMDSAGSRYLRAWDGKDLNQICIELIDPAFPVAMRGSSDDHEEYWERELDKWEEIVHHRWNWRAYCTPFPIQSEQDDAA